MMHIKWVNICGWTNKGRRGLCLSGHGDDDIDSKSDMFPSSSSSNWWHFLMILKVIIVMIRFIFKIGGESGFGVSGWILGVIIASILTAGSLSSSGLSLLSLLLHFQWFNHESIVSSLPSGGACGHVLCRWNNNWIDWNRYLVGSRGGFVSFNVIFMEVKKLIAVRLLVAAWPATARLRYGAWSVVMPLRRSHGASRLDWARAL